MRVGSAAAVEPWLQRAGGGDPHLSSGVKRVPDGVQAWAGPREWAGLGCYCLRPPAQAQPPASAPPTPRCPHTPCHNFLPRSGRLGSTWRGAGSGTWHPPGGHRGRESGKVWSGRRVRVGVWTGRDPQLTIAPGSNPTPLFPNDRRCGRGSRRGEEGVDWLTPLPKLRFLLQDPLRLQAMPGLREGAGETWPLPQGCLPRYSDL